MFELDNRKDQVMTVSKVALVNLVMWTRYQYFPLTYAHATWKRLAPFFHLPGRVTQGPRAISVELRPFNDRQLTHDLVALCERVNQASLQLPDGRHLLFSVSPFFDRQQRRQDCALASTEGWLDRDSQRCYTPADIRMLAGCTAVDHCGVLPGSFGVGEHGERHVRAWANLSCLLGEFTPTVEPPNGFLIAKSDPALLCRVLPRRAVLPLPSGV